jgi:hypothetical protein
MWPNNFQETKEVPFPGFTRVRVTYPGCTTRYHNGLGWTESRDEPKVAHGIFHGLTVCGRKGNVIYEDLSGIVHVVSPDIVEFM